MRKVKKNSTSEGFKFGAGVVIGIIAIIFLFFLFFSLRVDVELQGANGAPIALKPTIQPNAPSQQNAPNLPSVSIEPEDNRAQCPAGNRADSGQKTDDWFGCKGVEAILNLEKDYEKIDCSNKNNFNLSILDFKNLTEKNKLLATFCPSPDNEVILPLPVIEFTKFPIACSSSLLFVFLPIFSAKSI